MQPELQPKKVRLSIQISYELKSRLSQLSAFQGKKGSALVRESIEEKMEQAYQALAQENLKISEDFKYVDSENL